MHLSESSWFSKAASNFIGYLISRIELQISVLRINWKTLVTETLCCVLQQKRLKTLLEAKLVVLHLSEPNLYSWNINLKGCSGFSREKTEHSFTFLAKILNELPARSMVNFFLIFCHLKFILWVFFISCSKIIFIYLKLLEY